MLVAGLFFAAYGARALYLNARARSWPLVEGRVLQAGMNYAKKTPQFELRYRYEVAGTAYDGWTDDLSDELVDGRTIYSEGAPLSVHVNPRVAAQSFVKPAFHLPHLGWILAGLGLAATGLWMSWEELFGLMGLWPGIGARFRRPMLRR
jgi:hypothetical protein